MKNPKRPLPSIALTILLVVIYTTSVFASIDADETYIKNTSARVESDSESYVETITVSGTKTARRINEIAASVTTITSERIDALGANNIRDILRYEPGVSVEGSGRYGLSSFNIRGINGDRVLILVDGIPIADEFSFGPNLSARRDFVDVDLIQSVDIVRGPASTLYGSDAIGGVVAFQTKDPKDLIPDNDAFAGRAKLGYVSQSNESYANAMLAGLEGNWQWLLNATIREGEETRSFYDDNEMGDARNSADPQTNNAQSLLAKLIYQANKGHKIALIGEHVTQSSNTDLQSEVTTVVVGTTTLSSLGFDEQERSRISMRYLYEASSASHLKRIEAQTFYQNSLTKQRSELTRVSLTPNSTPFFRTRDSEFEQTSKGMHMQIDHGFTWGAEHYLIYGISVEENQSMALRTGQTLDIASGQNIPEFSVFPARDFPISTLFEKAIFIQDEIQLLNGALLISPGLRYDTFKLRPEVDELFSEANPGVSVSEFDDNQLSTKLGAIYNISENYSFWLQYAEGFRIPPMDDVNVGFTNFLGRYTSLSNPNLKPESVASVELGLRGTSYNDAVNWSISAYRNDYDNFIESLAFVGISENGFTQFQAINLDAVEISGLEGQISWSLEETFASAANWQLRVSYSIQDSENKATGEDVESILPSQAVAGIQYQDYSDPWRIELVATYTESAQAIGGSGELPFFEAPSHTTFDLLGHYRINQHITINGGIFNITDKEYWLASEVKGQSESANLKPLSAVGRNASVNVVMTF